MIRACLLVIAGGLAAQHSRVPLSSDLCTLGLVASLCLLCRKRTRGAGFLFTGFLLFMQVGLEIIDDRLDERFAGDSMLTQVRIADFPEVSGESLHLLVSPIRDPRLPRLSRVSWYAAPVAPALGETWELELRLRPPRGSSNPGAFDYEAWLFRQRIHATGYVVPGKRNRLLESTGASPRNVVRQDFVNLALEVSAAEAAVIAAVGVGARHLVSSDQWERYAASGTSHLMAISGLHVGLAAASAYLAFSVIFGVSGIVANPQAMALPCSVLAAAAYAALSGFGVPAQRATLMLVIATVAVARRRQVDPAVVLAAAALAVYLIDPVSVMAPGFSLSFLAVAALLWLARHQQSPVAGFPARQLRALQRLLTMQCFLLLGLMPLTVLLFQRIAMLAMPANLVAVPVFSFVTVPLTLVSLVIRPLSESAARVTLQLAAAGVAWVEAFIDGLLHLPLADIRIASISGFMWVGVLLPALWVLLPKGWPGRRLAPLAAAALVVQVPDAPPRGCLDTHVLDAGQGLAVVIQTHRRFLVYDAGMSFRGGGSVGEQVVLPFLVSRGATRIDWVLISHADLDHSGGLKALTEHAEIGSLLAGEALPGALQCVTGQAWFADGLQFRILHPASSSEGAGNNASCVLLVTAGRHGVLLTGDIEAKAEREILQRSDLRDIDIVVVPHHGSLTSSSMPFVDAASPLVAVVSAGYRNRWGFPKEAVAERWRSVGAEVVTTASSGAVSLRLCREGGLVGITKDRERRRRFWREGPG